MLYFVPVERSMFGESGVEEAGVGVGDVDAVGVSLPRCLTFPFNISPQRCSSQQADTERS